jgi:tetratricopeptide (TPR) repeat protein
MRGGSYGKLKDYSSAIKDYNKAIELNPNDANIYSMRGALYGLSNDYKSATLDARKACSLNDCKLLQALEETGYLQD